MGGLWWAGRSGGGFGGARKGIVVAAPVFVYFGGVSGKTLWAEVYARGDRWAFAMRMFNMSKSTFWREVRASGMHSTIDPAPLNLVTHSKY
jgi:hypothetical protein